MNQREKLVQVYLNEMKSTLGISKIDEDLLRAVVVGLGPSIYLPDASKVSTSDPSELNRVKKNFCIKKLKESSESKIDEAIKKVSDQFGSSNRNKYRAIFYYLLTKELKKESVYK